MIVADFIAEVLVERGLRHVFGVGGANIEDLFAAVQRRRPEIQAILGKHEHAAGTAADAYARLTGDLAVVMTTSGGGAMNVVHALAEAFASRVPLLAFVGEPPTDVQGRGAFQDTSGRDGAVDAAQVFGAVSVSCARAARAGDLPGLLEAAIDAATGQRPGPAVLLVAKDLQRTEIPPNLRHPPKSRPRATAEVVDLVQIRRAAPLLDVGPVVIVAGDEVSRTAAQEELAHLARLLDARVALAPDALDAFDNRDERFLGVTGAMGHSAVPRAMAEAGVCFLAGTRLPLLARQGLEPILREKPLLSFGREPPFLRSERFLHVGGGLRDNLRALVAEVRARAFERAAPTPEVRRSNLASEEAGFGSPAVLGAIERALPNESVVVIDAGNTGAQVVHHLRAPRGGRWLLAMGMAGMGYSFGAAVGAALATGRRCTVLAGDGAFFMQGLDVHTAIEHALPITYVIFNNRAHGMCLVRERVLLGEESGYNTFRASHIGAGLAAMFPGLPACDCGSVDELEHALARAAATRGPSVIGVELPAVEIPPFAAFQQAIAENTPGGGRT
jgi:acetolactate synthase-1/2/3 large subunit